MTPPCCEVWNCSDPTAFACLAFEPPPRMPPMSAPNSLPKWIEDPHRTQGQLALHRIGINHPGSVPGVDQPGPIDDNSAMGEASPEFEQDNIARRRRSVQRSAGRRLV